MAPSLQGKFNKLGSKMPAKVGKIQKYNLKGIHKPRNLKIPGFS